MKILIQPGVEWKMGIRKEEIDLTKNLENRRKENDSIFF